MHDRFQISASIYLASCEQLQEVCIDVNVAEIVDLKALHGLAVTTAAKALHSPTMSVESIELILQEEKVLATASALSKTGNYSRIEFTEAISRRLNAELYRLMNFLKIKVSAGKNSDFISLASVKILPMSGDDILACMF